MNIQKQRIDFDVFVAAWNLLQNYSTPVVHIRIANWLQNCWDNGNKHLLLMAFRACGKSSLVGLFATWILVNDPNQRILVLAADLALSRKMVRNIKKIIERHPLAKHLKPKNPDQWGAEMLTVERSIETRDPSVLARSVLANMTGSRADIIICDDVEVPNTCDTPNKRLELRERLMEIDYVLVPGGTQLYVGTPHNYFSIYADTPREEIGEERIFLHGFERLVVPIVNEKDESVWADRFPLEEIKRIKAHTGPNKFSSQMMLEPVNIAEGRLNVDDLIYYDDELSYMESQRQVSLHIGDKRMVSASCWWDPSFRASQGEGGNGDGSVIAAVFTDEQGVHYLHGLRYLSYDLNSSKDEATQQCEQVAAFLLEFYLPFVCVEINGIGRFLPGLLRQVLSEKSVQASVREHSNRRPKDTRILESFDAILAARKLCVHQSVCKTPFIQEMKEWRPGLSGQGVDDGLDAVAGALSLEPVRLKSNGAYRVDDWRGFSSSFKAKDEFEI